MANLAAQGTLVVVRELGLDARWWFMFNVVTLIVALVNPRGKSGTGSLKFSWAEAMVPTLVHDALALLAALSMATPGPAVGAPRAGSRAVYASSAYRRLAKPYVVTVALLKVAFDVCLCLWLQGDLSWSATAAVAPGVALFGLVFVKQVAMLLSNPDDPR